MYDGPDPASADQARDPAQRAREKADELRMHAELAAVFEARRKYGAGLIAGLDPDVARQVQRAMAQLEKSKTSGLPILPPASYEQATALLEMPLTSHLAGGDYHIHRRPGETMVVRWLEAEAVESFYQRLQAHFEAGLEQVREDERQEHGWKQDAATQAYLDALDRPQPPMAQWYLRPILREHRAFALSTVTADELDILHLCEHLMGVEPADLVGSASAPPDDPSEHHRAWFFRLFALRGITRTVERMCFFGYLQKAEDSFDLDSEP